MMALGYNGAMMTHFKLNNSLSTKKRIFRLTTGICSLAFVVLFTAISIFYYSFSKNKVYEELSFAIMTSNAEFVRMLVLGDTVSTANMSRNILDSQLIHSISFYDNDGELQLRAGSPLSISDRDFYKNPKVNFLNNSIISAHDIIYKGDKYGEIVVESSFSDFFGRLFTHLFLFAIALFLMLFFLIRSLNFCLEKYISDPLSKLSLLINQYAESNEVMVIEDFQINEINSLKHSFQQMTLSLKAKNIESKKYRTDLATANQRLQATLKTRMKLLSNVSHEIRNPLNVIIGFSEIMKSSLKETSQENLHVFIEKIDAASKDLLTIANDFLDFTTLEKSELKLSPSQIHLEEFVNNLSSQAQVLAHQNNNSFTIEWGERIDYFYNDSARIKQCLINVISNACKFTKNGDILFFITKDNEFIKFIIKDTGQGIPKDKLSTIFEQFYQVDPSFKKKHIGFGLGLSITKEITELMGGSIKVSSIEGKGSIFELKYPVDMSIDSKASELTSVEPFNKETSPKIDIRTLVIVEDSEDNRNLYKILLSQLDYETVLIENGREGLEVITKTLPQCVILDMGLPGIDGDEIVTKLRSNPTTKNIPIIIVTALSKENEKVKKILPLIQGFFKKPVPFKDLHQRIQSLGKK